MTTNKLAAVKTAIKDGKLVRDAGGIAVTTEQSDKLGYDWRITSVNDVVVRRDYAEQADPVGTSPERAIPYSDGVPLINNAYYLVDGVVKVWMDEWVDWEVST